MNDKIIYAKAQRNTIMADICLGVAVAGVNALVVCMVAALALM